MLSLEEIEEYMIDGKISIKCEFCNTEQWFDDTQIEALTRVFKIIEMIRIVYG